MEGQHRIAALAIEYNLDITIKYKDMPSSIKLEEDGMLPDISSIDDSPSLRRKQVKMSTSKYDHHSPRSSASRATLGDIIEHPQQKPQHQKQQQHAKITGKQHTTGKKFESGVFFKNSMIFSKAFGSLSNS